jgi:hypothetical protein
MTVFAEMHQEKMLRLVPDKWLVLQVKECQEIHAEASGFVPLILFKISSRHLFSSFVLSFLSTKQALVGVNNVKVSVPRNVKKGDWIKVSVCIRSAVLAPYFLLILRSFPVPCRVKMIVSWVSLTQQTFRNRQRELARSICGIYCENFCSN